MKNKESAKLSPKARFPLAIIFSGLLTVVVVGCVGIVLLFNIWLDTGFWGWPYHGTRLRLVENELQGTVSALPQLDKLHLLATYDEIYSSHIHVPKKFQSEFKEKEIPPCYYGRRSAIFGTQLTEQEVIEQYVQELVTEGWQLVKSGELTNGMNEDILIDQAMEWSFFYSDVGFDYHQMKREYANLITIRVEYTWPKREGC